MILPRPSRSILADGIKSPTFSLLITEIIYCLICICFNLTKFLISTLGVGNNCVKICIYYLTLTKCARVQQTHQALTLQSLKYLCLAIADKLINLHWITESHGYTSEYNFFLPGVLQKIRCGRISFKSNLCRCNAFLPLPPSLLLILVMSSSSMRCHCMKVMGLESQCV